MAIKRKRIVPIVTSYSKIKRYSDKKKQQKQKNKMYQIKKNLKRPKTKEIIDQTKKSIMR